MFASLDRVDIVTKGPDGGQQYVQTDHRTAEQVEAEPELSVLFALVRVLNPRRMTPEGSPAPPVLYVAQNELPEFLCRAIAAAGGLLVMAGRQATLEGEPPPLEEIIAANFSGLARRVASERGVELTLEGVAAVEPDLAGAAGSREQDETAYWSSVMKLGSFGGEVVRAANGGRWHVSDSGTLPFALTIPFGGAEAVVNPLGKAIKRFENGEGDSLVALVEMIRAQA